MSALMMPFGARHNSRDLIVVNPREVNADPVSAFCICPVRSIFSTIAPLFRAREGSLKCADATIAVTGRKPILSGRLGPFSRMAALPTTEETPRSYLATNWLGTRDRPAIFHTA